MPGGDEGCRGVASADKTRRRPHSPVPRRTGELAVTGFRRRRAGPQRNLAAATLSSNFRARLKIGGRKRAQTACEIARREGDFESFL